MPTKIYKAKSRIPVRSERSLNHNSITGYITPGSEVMITSKRTIDNIVYGRIDKDMYVILERVGKFSNFIEMEEELLTSIPEELESDNDLENPEEL